MSRAEQDTIYGHAVITPGSDVVAGSYGTWTLTYTVGKHGIDDGGHLKVAWRESGDWGIPQLDDPSAPNYLTVTTTGSATLITRFEHPGYVRPWKPCLTIDVFDGFLTKGDTITIVYGDTGEGSPGSKAQTFVEGTFEFRVLADPFGTCQYTLVPDPPVLRVVAGEAERLVVAAPSEAVIGEPTWLSVKAEDVWTNPATGYGGTIEFTSPDSDAILPSPYTFKPEDKGTHRFEGVVFQSPVIADVTVSDKEHELKATSNPTLVHEKRPERMLYWGDLHGQTETTVGTGTPDEYFLFARDAAALDFASHVGNDFQITREHYEDTGRVIKALHAPGKFVTFLGYEWSGNTAAGGDHNVYFLNDDQPIHRSSHALLDDRSDEDTDRYPVSRLCDTFRGRDDVLVVPHIGGRRANLDFHASDLTPFIEITSVHGHFEWFAREAMEKGLKVGFVGGSDDHTGRPGGARPTSMVLAVNGGYMGVYARELTREALWEAFQKRHVYASTGKRIILHVTCDEAMMGDELAISQPPTIKVNVIGTGPLEKVEIVRGVETIYSHPLINRANVVPGAIRIVWSGARVTTRRRNTDWSGGVTLDKGRIVSAEEFAFDLPWDGITERTDQGVRWHSTTSGDVDGVILRLDAPDDALMTFDTGPARFSFHPGKLDEPLVVEAGDIEQKVEVSRVPAEEGPRHTSFEFTDHNVKPGLNPYWIRVVQSDGEKAWSSPIFVDYKKTV